MLLLMPLSDAAAESDAFAIDCCRCHADYFSPPPFSPFMLMRYY